MNTKKGDRKTPLTRSHKRLAINASKGRILIDQVDEPDLKLEDLVAGITQQNIHHEVSFGRPVGNEAL